MYVMALVAKAGMLFYLLYLFLAGAGSVVLSMYRVIIIFFNLFLVKMYRGLLAPVHVIHGHRLQWGSSALEVHFGWTMLS